MLNKIEFKIFHKKELKMSNRQKIELEFEVKASTSLLFNRISTPSGLVEWFCDDVNIQKDIYTFIWDGDEDQARLLKKSKDKFIRFQWLETEDEEEYFEFAINKDELTGDVALIITDFVDEDEVEETEMLWENQVNELKNNLGGG